MEAEMSMPSGMNPEQHLYVNGIFGESVERPLFQNEKGWEAHLRAESKKKLVVLMN